MPENGRRVTSQTLASVTLPPLPSRPGTAVRLRSPTPPPRPESTLTGSPRSVHHHHQQQPPHIQSLHQHIPNNHQRLETGSHPNTSLSSFSSRSPQGSFQSGATSPSLRQSDPLPLLSADTSPITLTSPRTPSARQQNLYVDSPVKNVILPVKRSGGPGAGLVTPSPAAAAAALPCQTHPSAVNNRSTSNLTTAVQKTPLQQTPSHRLLHHHHHHHLHHTPIQQNLHHQNLPTSVIKQPVASSPSFSTPVKKGAVDPGGLVTPTSSSDSIICVVCGRCRCEACRSPRPLPSAWLCDNSCHLSAESVLDTLSCMCCVKAGLYHCGELVTDDMDTREESSWMDSPCSCSNNKWLLRWSWLAVMSIPLPCLFCYPVLRGVTKLGEKCFQSATNQGCRCMDLPATATPPTSSSFNSTSYASSSSPTDSEKRLLG